jgi:hypothetical protein
MSGVGTKRVRALPPWTDADAAIVNAVDLSMDSDDEPLPPAMCIIASPVVSAASSPVQVPAFKVGDPVACTSAVGMPWVTNGNRLFGHVVGLYQLTHQLLVRRGIKYGMDILVTVDECDAHVVSPEEMQRLIFGPFFPPC